jgi:hypothetical protein
LAVLLSLGRAQLLDGQADSGMYFVSASQAVLLDALTSPKPPCTRETAKTQFHHSAADPVLYTAQSLSCRRSLFGPRFANAKQQKFALDTRYMMLQLTCHFSRPPITLNRVLSRLSKRSKPARDSKDSLNWIETP